MSIQICCSFGSHRERRGKPQPLPRLRVYPSVDLTLSSDVATTSTRGGFTRTLPTNPIHPPRRIAVLPAHTAVDQRLGERESVGTMEHASPLVAEHGGDPCDSSRN